MKTIKLNLNNFSSENIDQISSELEGGSVLVMPTDTIYGLSALATNEKSIEKVYDIKRRDKKKPLVVVMKSFCMVREYCYLNSGQYKFLKKELEKNRPITVILKSRNNLPRYLVGNDESVAIRIPVKSDFLIKVLKTINKPLISTSLNISGDRELTDVKSVEKYFGATKPDVIINAGKISGKASRIVDIRNMDDIKILRK